jgi:hypothetical protein
VFREYLTRQERYERGLSMSNRLYELQSTNGWTEQETRCSYYVPGRTVTSKSSPRWYGLFFRVQFADYSLSTQPSNPFKVVWFYWKNTALSFSLAPSSGVACKPNWDMEPTSLDLKRLRPSSSRQEFEVLPDVDEHEVVDRHAGQDGDTWGCSGQVS